MQSSLISHRTAKAFFTAAVLLMLGCEAQPMMSSSSTSRGTTLAVELYEGRPPVVLISDEQSSPRSPELLNSAASQGDLHAHRLLGNAYWAGNGSTVNGMNPFPRNRESAVWYYRKAAEGGDAPSQYYFGLALETGDGVAEDSAAAYLWFERAAQAGHPLAHGRLGAYLLLGIGNVPADAAKALPHLRIAALAGDAATQFNLAQLYASGEGVDKSLKEAARWFWSAADLGHDRAMVELAKLLLTGEGIPKDERAARQWLELAAEEGNQEADALLEQQALPVAGAAVQS